MWQEIIVGLIAIVVLLYVGRRLYRMVKHAQEKTCGCGCAGCLMKNGKVKKVCSDE